MNFMKIGFDNDKYLKIQSEHIKDRISQFGDKLYLEFGGKLFDDYHAARVLPGFDPDAKIKLLQRLKDKVEIVICIYSGAIEEKKMPEIETVEEEYEQLSDIEEGNVE
mgnify:CR=1 FL=1